MIIQNFKSLATTESKKIALQILETGLRAANPNNFLKTLVNENQIQIGKNQLILSDHKKIFVVAYGKAADTMAKYVSDKIKISQGIVVIPKGFKSLIDDKKFQIFFSGHPLPNRESVKASKAIFQLVDNCSINDLVIFLVSGGGSSLVALPDGITLLEKKQTTHLLLQSGATIDEFNCIRKHLSQIKGGKLTQKIICNWCALIMSDVVSNDPSVISSGCTYYDKTTDSDAIKIIRKYSLGGKLPKNVISHLKDGSLKKIISQRRLKIRNKIIATNQDCLNAMASKSRSLGLKTKVYSSINDDVSISAKKLVEMIPTKKNSCVIFGGESTVHVKGNGKGGRNQELVLQISKLIHNSNNILISSIATDGIDGNTKYSGAIIENNLIKPKIISHFLKTNNSNSFFKKYGGLIKTGHTHFNLMDIGLILKY